MRAVFEHDSQLLQDLVLLGSSEAERLRPILEEDEGSVADASDADLSDLFSLHPVCLTAVTGANLAEAPFREILQEFLRRSLERCVLVHREQGKGEIASQGAEGHNVADVEQVASVITKRILQQ